MLFLLPYVKGLCSPESTILNLDIDQTFAMYHVLKSGNISKWEKEVLAVLFTLISINKNSKFLDIGSNIGFYSLAAKMIFGDTVNVTAIEPTPKLVATSEYLATLNNLQINILSIALTGDAAAQADFYIHQDDSCSTCIKSANAVSHIVVPAKQLSEIYDNHTIIKIDTEGTEFVILQPFFSELANTATTIIIEILNEQRFYQMKELCNKYGYYIYHLHQNFNIEPATEYIASDGWNFLLSPSKLSTGFYDYHARWRDAISLTFKFTSGNMPVSPVNLKGEMKQIFEYLRYKLANKHEFKYFPLTSDHWFAFYYHTMPRLIHYEYQIHGERLALCLHFETKDNYLNKFLRDLVHARSFSQPFFYNCPVRRSLDGLIYGIEVVMQFHNDYAHLDLYASLMNEFIAQTLTHLLENYRKLLTDGDF